METPSKEQTVVSPELSEKIARARTEILAEGQNPQAVAGRNIAEMGFMQALWETAKPHAKKLQEINFKNLKAQVGAVISIIPFVGEGKAGLFGIKGIQEGVRAGKEAKAAGAGAFGVVKEGWKAKGAFEAAQVNARLEKLVATNPFVRADLQAAERVADVKEGIKFNRGEGIVGKIKSSFEIGKAAKAIKKEELGHAKRIVETAGHMAGKGELGSKAFSKAYEVGTRASEKMHTRVGREFVKNIFNLTPDAPHWLTFSTAIAEMVGIHGADLIPAVLQMGKNTIDTAATYGRLTRDVWNLSMNRLTGKGIEVAKAARAFETKVPTPAGPSV